MTAPAYRIDRLAMPGCPHPIEMRTPLRIIDIGFPVRLPHSPAAGDRATADTGVPPVGLLPLSRTHTRIVPPSPDDRRERKRLAAGDRLVRGHGEGR